jgi:kynureninase
MRASSLLLAAAWNRNENDVVVVRQPTSGPADSVQVTEHATLAHSCHRYQQQQQPQPQQQQQQQQGTCLQR